MRARALALIPAAVAAALVLLLALPAAGRAQSAMTPSLEMLPPSAVAGATVEVSGSGFPRDTTVILELATTSGPIALATVATTGEGSFRDTVTLPARVPPGDLGLSARAPDGSRASYPFGSAMPRLEPAPASSGTATDADGASSDPYVLVLLGLLLGGLATGALFAWRSVHEDRHQPGMGAGDDLIWSDGETPVEPELTATDEPFWKRADDVTDAATPSREARPGSSPTAEREAGASA